MSASITIFEKEHAAREKYIYFICGIAGALVAYLGKDYSPNHPWTIHDIFVILTLICLIVSFLFGVGRILCYIHGISLNKDVLVAEEEISNIVDAIKCHMENEGKAKVVSINKKNGQPYTVDELQDRIKELNPKKDKDIARMKKWFNCSTVLFVNCHVFLIIGFILMICATFAA